MGRQTLEAAIQRHGPEVKAQLRQRFAQANAPYPPQSLTLIGLKAEKQLELWAKSDKCWRFIHRYPVLAASGVAGPKLREGDRQVPEGIYQLESLNPNSRFHLSMKLNYPNDFDWQQARAEGRTEPGSNIFIHGKASSVGCLAIGDAAIEELFVLVHRVGLDQVQVLISPHDVRERSLLPLPEPFPSWLPELYRNLARALAPFHRIKATDPDQANSMSR